MVHALNHQEASAGIVIYLRERDGVELRGIPIAQDFLVPDLGWMTVSAKMISVGLAGLVEIACVPIAALAGGLRAEVNPDPNLAWRSHAGSPDNFSR
jgi:hypothetical protein